MNYKCFILMLFVLFLSMSMISANEIGDNVTAVNDESPIGLVDDINCVDEYNIDDSEVLQVSSQEVIKSNEDDVIVVNNWEELQYYCGQLDKDYTLKLKENTNFYPSDMSDSNQQIKFKNNVKIIGSEDSWIGDSSPNARNLAFLAMQVEDNAKVGITLENVTFKWISAGGGINLPDGIFLRMGGKNENQIVNCMFSDSLTKIGHSCLIHLKKGTVTFDNCSFTNLTNGYGVLSVYDPNSVKTNHMIVQNC